jgi:hypothetical protein
MLPVSVSALRFWLLLEDMSSLELGGKITVVLFLI